MRNNQAYFIIRLDYLAHHKQIMPTEQKSNRYHKRSHSSSSDRGHRNRERRTYEKEKPDKFEKYHRRSRSRSPPRAQSQKTKYTLHYQHKDDKRYYDSYRDNEKNKYYDSSLNKSHESSAKYYDNNSSKRDHFQKRDRDKGEDGPGKLKYSRYEENDYIKNRDRLPLFEKKERGRNSPERERKRRRSSSSKSRSKSSRSPVKNEKKPITSKKSPPQQQKDQDLIAKNQRQQEPQRPRFPPPPTTKLEKEMDTVEQKIIKQFVNISPIKRQSQAQFKQIKPIEAISKAKVNKFQLLLNQARQNLSVAPPKSTFLLLEAFKTMNKFQVQTLDQKWANYLKKDQDKYSQLREETMCKLAENSQTANDEGKYEFGKQYLWIKEDRNEQQLDLRFRFEEFKQHNANINQLMRKLRFLD